MSDKTPPHPALLWARWRFSIISGLLVRPPAPGQLGHELQQLAATPWRHPIDEGWITCGRSTIERWYYTARDAHDPIGALTRKVRSDAGTTSAMSRPLLVALKDQYTAHPSWTYKLQADNLAALADEDPERFGPAVSESTVRRRMKKRGWIPRKRRRNPTPGQRKAELRLENREVRSFEATHIHALWHYDFHEAKKLRVVDADGGWHTPFALCILDDCSRLGCHAQWYLAENAENLVHGLEQACCKRGLPRGAMHDNGGAMRAQETTNGLQDLSITSFPTLAYSPYQNGKGEAIWEQFEGRLLAMLEAVEPLTLGFLNLATQAWMEMEYNRTKHEEIGMAPLERALSGESVARPAPDLETLHLAFSARVTRTQRRSDGTISLESVRFELPSHLRTLEKVCVRYRSWDLTRAWIVDERTSDVLARVRPQDKIKNADGRRRTLEPLDELPESTTPTDDNPVPPLMRRLLEEYAATGLPAAYLPKDEAVLACPSTPRREDG